MTRRRALPLLLLLAVTCGQSRQHIVYGSRLPSTAYLYVNGARVQWKQTGDQVLAFRADSVRVDSVRVDR